VAEEAEKVVLAVLAELERQGARPQDMSSREDLSAVRIFEPVDLNRLVAVCIAAARGVGS
jgi:hypothetical protein